MTLREFSASIFFFLVLVLILFAPLFFGEYALFDADTYTYDYPISNFYSKQFQNGEDRTINNFYLGGFPSVISPVGNAFDPIQTLLLKITDDGFTANHIRILLSVLAGLLFSFAFGRVTKLSVPASVTLALSYLMAQTLTGMTSGLPNSGSFFVMPALMLCVYVLSKKKEDSRWILWVFVGTLLLSYGWLAGLIQTVFYSVIFAGAYAMFLDAKESSEGIMSFRRWRTVLRYSTLVFGSVIIAIPFLLQTVLFRTYTLRIGGFGSSDFGGLDIVDLFYFLMPNYLTVPFLSVEHNVGLYIGALPFLFAVCALVSLWREPLLRFCASVYGFVLLLLIPTLGLSWLLQQLPVFSLFHSLERLLLAGAFFVSYMSAIGFEHVSNNPHTLAVGKKKFALILSGILIGAILAGSVALAVVFMVLPWENSEVQFDMLLQIFNFLGKDTSVLMTQSAHYIAVFDTALHTLRDTFSPLNWGFLVPLFLLPAGWILIWAYAYNFVRRSVFIQGALLMIVANIFVVYAAQFHRYIPRALFEEIPTVAEDIKARESDPYSYYALGFLTGEAMFRNFYAKNQVRSEQEFYVAREYLTRNINMLYEIPRLDGYEPFQSVRSHYMWNTLIQNEILARTEGHTFDDDLDRKKRELYLQLEFLGSLNVAYIISGFELQHPLLEEVARNKITEDVEVYLYNNRAKLPRVYVPEFIRVVKKWSDSDISYTDGSVIECEDCTFGDFKNGNGVFTQKPIVENGTMRANLNAKEDTWIVFAQSNIPGWKAYIDGEETKIYSANFFVQSVLVPAGKRDVVFRYEGQRVFDALTANSSVRRNGLLQ